MVHDTQSGVGSPVQEPLDALRPAVGRLVAKRETGRGATTGVRLPLSVPAPAAAAPVAPAAPAPSGRILLVVDEAIVRDVHAVALRQFGYQVATAAGGEEALAALESSEHDLVILDQRMPGLSGAELAVRIDGRWPTLPVILLTGCGTDAGTEIKSGNVAKILGKPVPLHELAAAVAGALAPPSPS